MDDLLKNIFTISEVSALWGISKFTVASNTKVNRGFPPRFRKNEMRRSGKTVLLTREGVDRLFGPQPNRESWERGLENEL